MSAKKNKVKRVEGDRFIICTFPLRYGPYIIHSDNSLGGLMAKLPEAIVSEQERVSVCSVDFWVANESDVSDSIPKGVRVLFEADPDLESLESLEECLNE